jgi:hypothetical protein
MYKKSFLQPILFGLIAILFVSCDKDFNELGTDIVGEDHFGFEKNTDVTVIAHNQKLGPIASNNLPVNALGFYNNPAFGTTQANFVTQVELPTFNPTFNNTDAEDYGDLATVLDSVVLDIPYFKTFIKKTDEVSTYRLDSIYGSPDSKFKLSLYQSNYFLRDLDPNQEFTEQQAFYTDEDNTIESNRLNVLLNNAPQSGKNADGHENNAFFFDKKEQIALSTNDDGEEVVTRTAPSMRLHLDKAFFNTLIIDPAAQAHLGDQATFKNFFRGIYFKVENGAPGHMALLNFKGGKITLYYNEDKKKTTTPVTFERVNKTFVLNLTGNTVSLLQNSAENANYLTAANSPAEAEKLYLKGGQGSIAILDLFGDPAASDYDTYGYTVYKNAGGDPIDENDQIVPLDANGDPLVNHYLIYKRVNSPNGIADQLDELRFPAHLTAQEDPGQIFHSIKNRWMINEANLTFNIVTGDMQNAAAIEPIRIFLYDLTNKKVVVDYTFDGITNPIFPKFNKGMFGGILLDENGRVLKQRNDDENTGGVYTYKGSKYKIRITNHIRNLIKNDSTNVRLGVSVTESIANIGFSKLRTPNSNTSGVPTMSVMSPLGTILYGTSPIVPDDKKLKLEIYFTKPN